VREGAQHLQLRLHRPYLLIHLVDRVLRHGEGALHPRVQLAVPRHVLQRALEEQRVHADALQRPEQQRLERRAQRALGVVDQANHALLSRPRLVDGGCDVRVVRRVPRVARELGGGGHEAGDDGLALLGD